MSVAATVDTQDNSDAESAVARLLARGRVGRATVRMHKRDFWELDFGRVGGRRLRRYRRSATAAHRLAVTVSKEIAQHGQLAARLTTAQRYEAAVCGAKLAEVGASITVATEFYLARHPLGGNSRTMSQVRDELVARKAKLGRSDRHVKGLDYKLGCLIDAVGDRAITAITTTHLEDELEAHPNWKPTTVHSAVQAWKNLFNFAVRRGYLHENPADKLELPKIIHDEPTIFSVDEVRRLLAATLFADRDPRLPQCRAWLAIGFFAGLRPEEIARLEWQHVCLATRTIRIKTANAKDRDRRIVDIAPVLAAWLAPIARSEGYVLERSLDDVRAAARAVLGLRKWPQDVMRHTFASYHFGEHRNEAATKHQMGHRDDGRIFYNHYCVPVARAEARQFWASFPPFDLLMSGIPLWDRDHKPVRMAA